MEEDCLIRIVPNLNCNVCENRKNLKIDVEDLSLLGYELLKPELRLQILILGKMFTIIKLNFSLRFPIITEDVQTLLKVIKCYENSIT